MSKTERKSALRVALITGASYGIGAAAAMALAEQGWDLAITATKESNLQATCAAVSATAREVLPLALSLTDPASIDAAVRAVLDRFGRLDALVNNAGATLRRPAVDLTMEDWRSVMEPNVTGTFFLTQAVGRHMIATGTRGSIVMVGSSHAIVGSPGQSTYGISKAAMTHMARMLAVEWASHGITVNTVAPGRIVTESPARAATTSDEKYMEGMRAKIPLQRFATAREVGETIAFMCSPGAASITGQMIVVDGGMTSV